MSDFNPYAAPQVTDEMTQPTSQDSPVGVWRKGNLMVMHKSAVLPNRCVKSNEPAERQLQRKLSWHHPAVYLALLLNLLIYLILALALGKKVVIHVGLSDRWFAKRRRAILIGWSLVLASVASLVCGFFADPNWAPAFIIASLPLFFIGVFWGLLGARMVYAKKIDANYIWLGGVHASFLETLPPWPYAG